MNVNDKRYKYYSAYKYLWGYDLRITSIIQYYLGDTCNITVPANILKDKKKDRYWFQ